MVGSEVDGFKWLNQQWHIKEPVHPNEIKDYDAILISQSYTDHCHTETLDLFDDNKPILASELAYKRLTKFYRGKKDIHLMKSHEWTNFNQIEIMPLHPGNKMDPVYFAHVLKSGDSAIFYASHGFKLSDHQWDLIKDLKYKLLITTFTEFSLPKIMGGKVNPGMENVQYLVDKLNPEKVMNTHDEQKKMKGLVSKLAKINYQDFKSNKDLYPFEYIYVPNYEELNLS